jgi:colanic acid/amylovoran biosynthesis protein
VKKSNIGIIGASLDTDNLGVNVLLSGLVKCARHAFPDAYISVIDYGKKNGTFVCMTGKEQVTVRLLVMRFSIRLFQWNNIVVLLALTLVSRLLPPSLRNEVIRRNNVLREIDGMDIIGSIAGGDSFSDIYGMTQFLYVTLPQLLVIFSGKKLVQYPQTYGPYKRFLARSMARFILARSSPVFSRDQAGVSLVRGLVKKRNKPDDIRFLYDVGFVLDPLPPTDGRAYAMATVPKADSPIIGLNISGLLYMGGYSHDNMFNLKFDYATFIERLIHRFISIHHTRVVMIPHVFGSIESDLNASTALYNRMAASSGGMLYLVSSRLNHHEVKYIIGKCDFFIGSRMHACIAALSQCIPAVGLAYSNKFHGVMASIGVEALVVDPSVYSAEECMERIDVLFTGREKHSCMLKRSIPLVENEVLTLFSTLTSCRVL